MKKQNFIVVFEQEEDGGFSVSVPSLPGCFSQGDTFEEATKNIREAIELYLEDEKKDFWQTHRTEFAMPLEVASHF